MAEEDDRFDSFLSTIGFGKWQLPAVVATLTVMATMPVHLIGSPFLSAPMAFRCSDGQAESSESLNSLETNLTSYFDESCLSPVDLSHESPTTVGQGMRPTGLASCPFVEYDTSLFASSVISDFDLICERAWLRPLFVTSYMTGLLLGGLSGGCLGDKWGRRRTVQLSLPINILAVLVTISSWHFLLVLLMRLLAGISLASMINCSWSLSLECCPCKYRGLLGMLMGLPYSVFVIVFAGIAYLVRTWHFLFVASASPVLLLIPFSFRMDESPRWLLQMGKGDEAKKILQNAVRLNDAENTRSRDLIDKLIHATSIRQPKSEDTGMSSAVTAALREAGKYIRTPAMCKIIVATAVTWFMGSILYIGVAINANNFTSEDPFLYVALTGVMDGTAILAITPLTTRVGRRVIVGTGFAIGGTFFLVELVIPETFGWARWIFVMGGFLLVAGALQVSYMYAPELFPTECRARGLAFVQMMGSIGSVCAPIITNIVSQYAWWASGVAFGCAGLVGSLMLLIKRVTKNCLDF